MIDSYYKSVAYRIFVRPLLLQNTPWKSPAPQHKNKHSGCYLAGRKQLEARLAAMEIAEGGCKGTEVATT